MRPGVGVTRSDTERPGARRRRRRRQYKYTHAAHILLCIVCGVFSIQYGGPARYLWFALGSVLFWGEPPCARALKQYI